MTGDASRALAEIDAVLAGRPHADSQRLAEAAKALSRLRDALAAGNRDKATPDGRGSLQQMNGIISVVLAVHFPLGPIPWPALEAARASLAHIATEQDA
jgi:hypothetical protein